MNIPIFYLMLVFNIMCTTETIIYSARKYLVMDPVGYIACDVFSNIFQWLQMATAYTKCVRHVILGNKIQPNKCSWLLNDAKLQPADS